MKVELLRRMFLARMAAIWRRWRARRCWWTSLVGRAWSEERRCSWKCCSSDHQPSETNLQPCPRLKTMKSVDFRFAMFFLPSARKTNDYFNFFQNSSTWVFANIKKKCCSPFWQVLVNQRFSRQVAEQVTEWRSRGWAEADEEEGHWKPEQVPRHDWEEDRSGNSERL